MDKRLNDALDISNFNMVLNARQKNLKKLFDNKLLFPYEGGVFKADEKLLFSLSMITLSKQQSWIFIDQHDIPIKVDNIEDFFEQALRRYEKAITQYYDSFQKLKDARNIRKAVNWVDEAKEE